MGEGCRRLWGQYRHSDNETEDQPLFEPSEDVVHENSRQEAVLLQNGAGCVTLVHRVGQSAEAGRLNFSKDSFNFVFGERVSGGRGGRLELKLGYWYSGCF